jgi:hypothetical protein
MTSRDITDADPAVTAPVCCCRDICRASRPATRTAARVIASRAAQPSASDPIASQQLPQSPNKSEASSTIRDRSNAKPASPEASATATHPAVAHSAITATATPIGRLTALTRSSPGPQKWVSAAARITAATEHAGQNQAVVAASACDGAACRTPRSSAPARRRPPPLSANIGGPSVNLLGAKSSVTPGGVGVAATTSGRRTGRSTP